MSYRFVLTAVLCSTVLTVSAEPELTGTPRELTAYLADIPDTVPITGTAERKLPADKAIIHITVSTEDKSMDAAIARNHSLRTEITSSLVASGLPPDAVQAAQFSSTPQSGMFSDKIKSYSVENTMKITVINEAQFRAVAALIDSSDDIRYEKTEFELADRKAKERELLAEACQDAAAKKAVYETGIGVSLTPVSFSEGRVIMKEPQPVLMRAKVAFESYEADTSTLPPAQFDEIQLNATVTVRYRLEAAQP